MNEYQASLEREVVALTALREADGVYARSVSPLVDYVKSLIREVDTLNVRLDELAADLAAVKAHHDGHG